MNQINGDDLSTMINLEEFGESILYTPENSSEISISALYQEPEADASVGLEVEMIANLPSVIVRAVDITWSIDPADRITIRGNTYKPNDFNDDKLGAIEIFLHRV